MKILIIDDNPVDLMIANAVITKSLKFGEVVLLDGVDSGISYLKNNIDDLPSVIFLDINMPLKTGWDFLSELACLPVKDVRVFMLSSSTSDVEITRSKENPLVEGFVSKPLDSTRLQQIISAAWG